MKTKDLNILNTILNNIKLVRAVRDQIENIPFDMSKRSFECVGLLPHSDLFNNTIQLDEGLCHNLGLFQLIHIKISGDGGDSPLTTLGDLWIKKVDPNDLSRSDYSCCSGIHRSVAFPVAGDGDERCNMFSNPERWEYLDFVEYQIKHIIENGEFAK